MQCVCLLLLTLDLGLQARIFAGRQEKYLGVKERDGERERERETEREREMKELERDKAWFIKKPGKEFFYHDLKNFLSAEKK